jgi:tRNA-(ms[2]io[6]A)-hydroxylase
MDAAPPISPLRWTTARDWVALATADPLALLNDHAHLERKATTNALELISRWPYTVALAGSLAHPGADRWTRLLASVARDEARHLTQVLALLMGRGGHFERSHLNPYAAALRSCVRRGDSQRELLDRLLVSALIEARSGERFRLLAEGASDPELARLYASLVASEEGHYRVFLDLARLIPEVASGLDERWDWLLEREAAIVSALPTGSGIHTGGPGEAA